MDAVCNDLDVLDFETVRFVEVEASRVSSVMDDDIFHGDIVMRDP